MAQKQCEKCGDQVDESKAFCPGCGHALLREEQRATASNFDTMDSTVQLGQTMYNQMLSDMGLNISKAPDPAEKKIEVVAPVQTELKPVAEARPVQQPPAKTGTRTTQGVNTKIMWIIAAVAAVLLFLAAVVVVAAVLIFWWQVR